jgi:hypothetical protein
MTRKIVRSCDCECRVDSGVLGQGGFGKKAGLDSRARPRVLRRALQVWNDRHILEVNRKRRGVLMMT